MRELQLKRTSLLLNIHICIHTNIIYIQITAQNKLFYMRFFVNADRWIAKRRLYIIVLCNILSIKRIKRHFNSWKYLILANIYTSYHRRVSKLNSLYLIGNVNCPLCHEIRETFQRPRQQALYRRAARRARLSAARRVQCATMTPPFKADIFRRFCLRAGWYARVNSRRVPLMCQEQTFPESSIYAGTPGMQMKRVVLRRSLPRRGTITAELLTKLN